ncbi:MAG: ribonuclease Y [Propionibacteriaceae bacterium]|nr:ribonuclease Y [Propionibacteriaceae bacterium]
MDWLLIGIGVFVVILAAAAALATWWTLRARARRDTELERRHQDNLETLTAQAQAAVDSLRSEAVLELERAKERGEEVLADAMRRRDELASALRDQRAELRGLRAEHERREARLAEREARVTEESERLAARLRQLDETQTEIAALREDLAIQRAELDAERERLACLTQEDARAEVLGAAEHAARLHAAALSREIEAKARREADTRARRIIVDAIQRLASEQTSESVVSMVELPSDEMKGRIIGREGRNIRAFEQVTGVNVMIDDTPETVLLSSFDPVRRETARLTLIDLIADGRIHPARIEELFERNTTRIAERVRRAGEDALAEVGISDLHPDLVPIVGSLTYRTSYGQNVLKHLVECAHLAGVMAAELGLDVALCKRSAFLHDIGKALTHEVEGSHAIIGADLARKYGEHPEVVHAIEAHHNEVAPQTVEAVLTQAADAISGSRPGARREALETYVERMQRLEQIATSREGVERVYAMQAGREVRVMVVPEVVDDLAAHALAREIAADVERELSYPGQIKITVVRESRATEMAH